MGCRHNAAAPSLRSPRSPLLAFEITERQENYTVLDTGQCQNGGTFEYKSELRIRSINSLVLYYKYGRGMLVKISIKPEGTA